MKYILVLLVALSHSAFAGIDYNRDVRVGLEAYSVGDVNLARFLLESALREYEKEVKDSGRFEDTKGLSEKNARAAVEHLFVVYFEMADYDALQKHSKKYGGGTNQWGETNNGSDIGTYKQVLRVDLWVCRTLDTQRRYVEAAECWDKAGFDSERNESVRAAAIVSTFKDGKKVITNW